MSTSNGEKWTCFRNLYFKHAIIFRQFHTNNFFVESYSIFYHIPGLSDDHRYQLYSSFHFVLWQFWADLCLYTFSISCKSLLKMLPPKHKYIHVHIYFQNKFIWTIYTCTFFFFDNISRFSGVLWGGSDRGDGHRWDSGQHHRPRTRPGGDIHGYYGDSSTSRGDSAGMSPRRIDSRRPPCSRPSGHRRQNLIMLYDPDTL